MKCFIMTAAVRKGRYEIKSGPVIEIEGTKSNNTNILLNAPITSGNSSLQDGKHIIPRNQMKTIAQEDICALMGSG